MSRLVSAEEARNLLNRPGLVLAGIGPDALPVNAPSVDDLAATVIALSGGFESCVRLATWMSDAREALDYNGCGMAGDEAIVLMKRLMAERDRLRATLYREGYAPCSSAACNCGDWHK